MALHRGGELAFFGDLTGLAGADAFARWLAPFRKSEWVVYAKSPFGGPDAVLAYLSRYTTHRVAISNSRLVSADAETVAFRWKDYRIKSGDRQKVMRLPPRVHTPLPDTYPAPLSADCFAIACPAMDGFHRIRHYGLLDSATRNANIAKIRAMLGALRPEQEAAQEAETVPLTLLEPRPCCGGPMRITEIFRHGQKPSSRAPPRDQAA